MKFGSCRIAGERFLINIFSKEYNKTVFEKTVAVNINESSEIFKEFDYIDLVVPAKDILFFTRSYPPVKSSYIRKIVIQDIEAETPFKESDLVVDMKNYTGGNDVSVFCINRNIIKNLIDNFDAATKEKIRSIVPEEVLFFKSPEKIENAIFMGNEYSVLVLKNGQIVSTNGLNDLKKDLNDLIKNHDSTTDFESWVNISGDISINEGLSDIEMMIRKRIILFFEKTFSFFMPYFVQSFDIFVFINDFLVPGTAKTIERMHIPGFNDNSITVYDAGDSLELIPSIVDTDNSVNFATGEFAYKGGFTFLKKRIILGLVLYFTAIFMLIAGMQMKIRYLDERIAKGEERTKLLMKEVIGKEMPSLRQAISIMDKTIKGEILAADKKSVYPYSALYIMEVIFPYFAFENSSIEVSEVAIREEGKIRVTGTSNSLEDINKFSELLELDPLIDEINRGQINTRNDKSSFNISFQYGVTKKEDIKGKKTKKKGTSKESENEI